MPHAHWDGRLEEITLRHIGNQDGLTVIAKNIRFCFVDLLLVVYFCSTLPFINLKLFSGCRNFSVTCISGEESFHQKKINGDVDVDVDVVCGLIEKQEKRKLQG
ncbi:hypothetical protein SDJN02_24411, partial [Cucurbita argyrosperma subsp. argyrosperma]